MKHYIKGIELIDNKDGREVHVTLENNSVVKICECCESWEQYGCYLDEKQCTVGIADLYNEWLHGGDEPDESDVMNEKTAIATEWIKENMSDVFGEIPNFGDRLSAALDEIEENRSVLSVADQKLYAKMYDTLSDWCDDNDYDIDLFSVDDIVL